VRLEWKLLLKDIAKDIYMEELFNRGLDTSNREKKPTFEEYVASLNLMVICSKNDNNKAK
jgi:hypothetical protein